MECTLAKVTSLTRALLLVGLKRDIQTKLAVNTYVVIRKLRRISPLKISFGCLLISTQV